MTDAEARLILHDLEHQGVSSLSMEQIYAICHAQGALDDILEAKRLLKLAVDDNKCVLRENFGDICQFCKHYSNSEAQCRKPHNGSGSWCCENAEWRYADEALKLLGEDGDTDGITIQET